MTEMQLRWQPLPSTETSVSRAAPLFVTIFLTALNPMGLSLVPRHYDVLLPLWSPWKSVARPSVALQGLSLADFCFNSAAQLSPDPRSYH